MELMPHDAPKRIQLGVILQISEPSDPKRLLRVQLITAFDSLGADGEKGLRLLLFILSYT